jgi:hypothetical protein
MLEIIVWWGKPDFWDLGVGGYTENLDGGSLEILQFTLITHISQQNLE